MTVNKKKKYLEALGRKLYNHKFSLPPTPTDSVDRTVIPSP